MNREELLEEIGSVLNKGIDTIYEGDIQGCFIWVRRNKQTEVQVY